MKEELGSQALKIKEKILDATYAYCNESIAEVNKIYMDM
jgi:preprotein translocase subunit SecE